MLLGALPAMGLLEAFGLTVYAPFVEVPPCPSPCNLKGCIQWAGTVCGLSAGPAGSVRPATCDCACLPVYCNRTAMVRELC